MIVCKQPIVIYDTDVIGAVVISLLAFALGGITLPFVGHPQQKNEQRAALTAARIERDRANGILAECREQALRLEEIENQLRSTLMLPSELPSALAAIVSRSQASHVELMQVAPQPPATVDDLRSIDIRIAARGRALDLLRMMHTLHDDYPWIQIESFELGASKTAEDACTLICTVRWFARMAGTGAPGAAS